MPVTRLLRRPSITRSTARNRPSITRNMRQRNRQRQRDLRPGKRRLRPQRHPRLPVVETERVIDPACAATIDLVNAPRATYQRKVYYFCSTADRDEFVKDPAAYLKKRGK